MRAPNELFIVEGGDHSLAVPKKQPQAEADERILHAIAEFVARYASRPD
jgi:hypothetical protein